VQSTTFLEHQLNGQKVSQSFIKIPTEDCTFKIKFSFSRKKIPPTILQKQTAIHDPLLRDEYAWAKSRISRINDPLWKEICTDLLNMMGPASVLKVWRSKLGEFSSQDKGLDFICETEEASVFVQQYDFVILGSLQRYFPALKQLRVKTISVVSH
jgi:hypothetical protein